MMNIIVIRDSGDKAGPGITDTLLTTVGAGAERGRVEIDTNYYNKATVITQVTDFEFFNNGAFIKSMNSGMVPVIDMLTGIEFSCSGLEAPVIKVTTERLEDDM